MFHTSDQCDYDDTLNHVKNTVINQLSGGKGVRYEWHVFKEGSPDAVRAGFCLHNLLCKH
jgi:hypothetical protein